MKTIHQYAEFVEDVVEAGFSMAGESSEGIFSLRPYYGPEIAWHTEDPETDPWEWRMRVLRERSDIAYGKFFFQKGGLITKEWFPYFYRLRRKEMDFDELYQEGLLSHMAKRVYGAIRPQRPAPLHEIKAELGVDRENRSAFQRAVTELQMRFCITICGEAQKKNGWKSTVFCRMEDFGEPADERISEREAVEALEEQIFQLNPEAAEKKVRKFIYG